MVIFGFPLKPAVPSFFVTDCISSTHHVGTMTMRKPVPFSPVIRYPLSHHEYGCRRAQSHQSRIAKSTKYSSYSSNLFYPKDKLSVSIQSEEECSDIYASSAERAVHNPISHSWDLDSRYLTLYPPLYPRRLKSTLEITRSYPLGIADRPSKITRA
jgi:hypothetical protein